MEKNLRNFRPTEWALKKQNTIYITIIALFLFGLASYITMPKEMFPEADYPTIFVSTIYPGNSASDIENLITDPLEKELKTLKNINDIKSTSAQDMSMIFVEFNPNVDADKVYNDVKDAVDRAKSNLPSDLENDPQVIEVEMNQLPIITLNISGNYSKDQLKQYADYLQDQLEKVPEISKVNISGLPNKEVQINIDPHKLNDLNITFQQIESAIKMENLTVSSGDIETRNTIRTVRIIGQFTNIDQIKNLIISSKGGKAIYLKDVAEVKETYADPTSETIMDGDPVISLQIIKKNKENIIYAIEHTFEVINQAKKDKIIPEDLKIAVTNDQSKPVKRMVNSLENNLLSGVILVIFVLLLFLGLRNGLIVGFSIPMSMFMTIAILKISGDTMNMMTFFSLILALGMLVDNAIVVTENIHRFIEKGYKTKDAVKLATSEVASPIISSTLTTLAAFFPLVFWNSLTGRFMKLLPLTLIIVLTSSLINALIFTPVIANKFIKPKEEVKKPNKKKTLIWSIILLILSVPFYIAKKYTLANIFSLSGILYLLYTFVLYDLSIWFQNKFLLWLENIYSKFIKYALSGKKPQIILIGTILLLIITIKFYFGSHPKLTQFPQYDPTFINIYVETPISSNLHYTDSIMTIITSDLNKQLKPYAKIIESEVINIGSSVKKEREVSVGRNLNKGQITINFVEYKNRHGISTSEITSKLANYFKNRYPGITITIDKNKMGPPTGKAIDIELKGNDFNTLLAYSDSIISRINNANIPGIENLEMDIKTTKPELLINVDKEKAGRFGIKTGQIISYLRTAIYGTEASKYKTKDDEYPIMIRIAKPYRNDIKALLNLNIINMTPNGKISKIPISSVTNTKMNTSFDAIKHIDTKRTITISSNVIEGYNANEINKLINVQLQKINLPQGYTITMGGEQKDMKKSANFLIFALLLAVTLILVILVTQFNSIIKPLIIVSSVVLSTIGVFGGLGTFKMDFVMIMTGIGIISLAGIVVNNAIVLIDYIDLIKTRKKQELGLEEDENLPLSEIIKAIEEAGKTRLRPVLLTAITTIFGLLTLAIGININYGKLLTQLKPDFYIGGESVAYWAPMAWAVIFGLTFATFMTLIVVPVMYLIGNKAKLRMTDKNKLNQ